jgi:signal peptidase I
MKRPFIAFGKSMKPAMQGATIVWCVKPKDLKVGDIVVYSARHKSMCHRIIGINQGDYSIKGDNAPEVDVVSFSKISYKVDSFRNLLASCNQSVSEESK